MTRNLESLARSRGRRTPDRRRSRRTRRSHPRCRLGPISFGSPNGPTGSSRRCLLLDFLTQTGSSARPEQEPAERHRAGRCKGCRASGACRTLIFEHPVVAPVTRELCDGASGQARCLHSRSVAARELVGAVDGTVPGGRLRAAGARLAGNLGHGRGNPEPRRPGGREGHRRCRRALRADHPRPGRAAHRDRPLLRRPDRPATAGPGPRGRGGGDRPGADQGRDLPAAVGAAGRLDRAAQPGEPEQGGSADPEQFRYGFGNALPAQESAELYERWTVPSPGKPLFEAASAALARRSPAKVDTGNKTRGRCSITAGATTTPSRRRSADRPASSITSLPPSPTCASSTTGATRSPSTTAGARSPTRLSSWLTQRVT